MRLLAPLLAACLGLSSSFVSLRAEELRVAGSDLLAGPFQKDLEAFAKQNDLQIAFDLRGSRLGLEALQKGRADFALLVFAAQDPRPGPEYSSAVIGYLASVVVVPSSVSLTQISYSQLGGVFGASEVSSHRRWSEIGALGEWSQRSISAMALRRSTGLSLDLFRHNVLQKPELKPTVALLDSADEAYARLRGEEGGIAILPSAPPENSGLKTLLVAKDAGDVAYPPTAENLHTGDYPLRLAVHVVFRKGEAGRFVPLLRHMLADETAPVFSAAGVTPLPVQARNQLVFDLETK
jgi:hypothetical protein